MSIQSVTRALAILSLFSAAKTHLGITEIGKALGLTNPTAHGLVRTLLENGFLEQDPDTKKYSLGVRPYELGHYYLGSSRVYQVGAAATHRLAQSTGLTTRLAIQDGNTIVVILNVYSRAERFQYYLIGPRIPHYCTALGKAVLAWFAQEQLSDYLERTPLTPYTPRTITDPKLLLKDLEQARSRGYATDREELIPGVACAGAPVFDQKGNAIASLSISSGTELLDLDNFSDLADELIQTSTEISYVLGYSPKIIPMRA